MKLMIETKNNVFILYKSIFDKKDPLVLKLNSIKI